MTSDERQRCTLEAQQDIDYAIRLSNLHERLFKRAHLAIVLAGLVAGSLAFASLFKPNAVIVTIAGAVIGILGLVEHTYRLGKLAELHGRDAKAFTRLRARTAKLTLDEIDAEFYELGADAQSVIESLRHPAFVDNLNRHGKDISGCRPFTRMERFMRAIA